jgi:hypothetical protein
MGMPVAGNPLPCERPVTTVKYASTNVRPTQAQTHSSGTKLRQGRTGDDPSDVPVVIAIGQSPCQVVEVGEVAVLRPQQRPHAIDMALFQVSASDVVACKSPV